MLFSGFAHRVKFLRINLKEKLWSKACTAVGVVPGTFRLVVPSLSGFRYSCKLDGTTNPKTLLKDLRGQVCFVWWSFLFSLTLQLKENLSY